MLSQAISIEEWLKAPDAKSDSPNNNDREKVLRKVLNARPLEKVKAVFEDPSKIQRLLGIINKHQLTTFTSKGPDREETIGYIVDHLLNHEQNEKYKKEFFDFCQKEEKATDPEMHETYRAGMVELNRKQYVYQQYHTVLHALEMRNDCQRLLEKMMKDSGFPKINRTLFSEIVGMIAAYHDIVQMEGQYQNEKQSADAFCRDFGAYFKAKGLSEAALKYIADKLIIEGTLLSISFTPPQHTALHRIICDVDQAFFPGSHESKEAKVMDVATCALSNFDINRANSKENDVKEFPDEMKRTLLDELVPKLPPERKDFNPEAFFPVFQVLIGQNIRMMADGGMRSFKTASDLALLQKAFDLARFAALYPGSKEIQNEYQQFIEKNLTFFREKMNFGGQIAFATGVNSAEAVETMKVFKFEKAAEQFQGDMRTNNAWGDHAVMAKALSDALPPPNTTVTDPSKLAKVYGALIFAAANQKGLDYLAEDEFLLRKIYQDYYGKALPSVLSKGDAKYYAILHMSVEMSVAHVPENTDPAYIQTNTLKPPYASKDNPEKLKELAELMSKAESEYAQYRPKAKKLGLPEMGLLHHTAAVTDTTVALAASSQDEPKNKM